MLGNSWDKHPTNGFVFEGHPVPSFDKIKDLVKKYDGKEILSGITTTIHEGEQVVVIGPSGSGKSTTIGMIPRLYDTDSGSVSIGTVNVKDFSLKYLRSNIGIVTQDTYLFNGTIRENLLYAKPDAIIFVDDPEIYIHHSIMQALWNVIEE